MKLIEEWRLAWRWFSMQAMVAVAALQGGWAAVPDDLKQHFPARLVTSLSVGLLLLGIGGRLVRQPRKSDAP
jgi:hypothetical protein